MTPFFADDWLTVYAGDCREVLPTLAADSVDCIVTSPPYWGLRDYGTATWSGGDAECDHVVDSRPPVIGSSSTLGLPSDGGPRRIAEGNNTHLAYTKQAAAVCPRCGATRQDAQLGLEATPELYVANLVAVFRELRRVLKGSGTCWLNLGDSYASHDPGGYRQGEFLNPGGREPVKGQARNRAGNYRPAGLKPKDLVGIPWRVAFALQQPYYTGTIEAETDRTWLAALMDGEGTFTILATASPHGSGDSYPPIAQVRMTSAGVVQKAASLVGVASPAQYPPSMKGKRGIFQWRLSGHRAAEVARELYPYLIEKRQQALVLWNHQQVRESYETKRGVFMPAEAKAAQKVCRDLIRRLNRGEPVVIPSWMKEPPSLHEPGWYLRSDVIWAKPNPMPESVTDRPTKAHEYLFLLTKSARYFYDADAVREPHTTTVHRLTAPTDEYAHGLTPSEVAGRKVQRGGRALAYAYRDGVQGNPAGRNLRSVWTIATRPYPGAHFAVFPPELPERCIKAGSSERGVCPDCGAPWERVVERELLNTEGWGQARKDHHAEVQGSDAISRNGQGRAGDSQVTTLGWQPYCRHETLKSQPAVILDPFAGSGTVGMVANRLSRRAILIDLNPEYVTQQMRRNAQTPLGLPA